MLIRASIAATAAAAASVMLLLLQSGVNWRAITAYARSYNLKL
jgi:hypothetical protein